jgi:menaquinone-dependent protoporphyrinogen oxidase
MKVLIAYASAHGSTRGIAERIAARLGGHGHDVAVIPVGDTPDPAADDAVVLGSAIHNQAWLPEAGEFVRRHRDALATRSVWLFSVGIPDALGRPLRRYARGEGRTVIAPIRAQVRARGHALFTGAVEPDHLPPVGRVIFRLLGGRYGDLRDWAAVNRWADMIAGRLQPRTSRRAAGAQTSA